MENISGSQTTPKGANATEALDSLAKNRSIIPVAFALIIVFFFFSFCDLKCNGVKVTSLTGINMVTGTHVKTAADNMFGSDTFNSFGQERPSSTTDAQKVAPNLWAILALLMAIGGVAAFYKKIKNESLIGTAAGVIGFVSLLLLRSAIKSKIEGQGGEMVQVEIDFLFGFWASVLCFVLAGGLSYLRLKQEKVKLPEPAEANAGPKPVTPLQVNIITQEKS